MRTILRPYQDDLIARVRAEFSAGKKRVMLYAPTGAGKTELAMDMIRRSEERGKRVLFIANRLELINQASRRFAANGIPHGVIQGLHPLRDKFKSIQIASIQTLVRRQLPMADFIVIDEAHGAIAPMYRKVIASYPMARVVGLSATPFSKGLGKTFEGMDGPLFESLVHAVTPQTLIEMGFLVDCRVYSPSKPDLTGVAIRMGDYAEDQLGLAVNKAALVGDIVHHWLKLSENRKTICFATNIAHSKHIVQQFLAKGVAAEHIDAHTDDEDRKAILDRLRNGVTRIVSNVAILAEGFDLPDLGCMILARPTRSLIRHIQMAGRCLRPSKGKEYALILDHAGVVESLGFPTDDMPMELCNGKPKEAKKREKSAPLPKVCGNCAYVKPPKVHQCPSCGFAPEVQDTVEIEDGDLVEYKRMAMEDKQQFYGELLAIADERGYKPGWAYHKYREKVGVFPKNSMPKEPITPSEETRNWIKSRDIAWAKKPKATMQCKCGSKNVKVSNGAGPHYKRADCMDCKKQWWLSRKSCEQSTTQ